MTVCINVILYWLDIDPEFKQFICVCEYSGHQGSAKQAANTTIACQVYVRKFLVKCSQWQECNNKAAYQQII